MDGWSAPGNWKDLSVGSVTATIRKYDDENTITVTVGPVNKKAVIIDSKGYLNQKEVGMYQQSSPGVFAIEKIPERSRWRPGSPLLQEY